MTEWRLNNKLTVRLPSRLEATIPSGKKKIYDLETKDISIDEAFIYTKESLSFPEGTRFIIDLTFPSDSNKELMALESLMECTGTMVRSTSEGIAIQFDRECEIIWILKLLRFRFEIFNPIPLITFSKSTIYDFTIF